MNIFLTFLTIAFFTWIGFFVIKAGNLLPKKSNLFIVSIGYGLGVGVVSTQLFIYARLGLSWNVLFLIFPWIIVIAFFYKKVFHLSIPKKIKLDKISQILLFCMLLVFSYTIFEALLRPVGVWDAWASWLLKSKAFFIDGTIRPDTLNYIGAEYPLIISLLGTSIYLIVGHVNDTVVLLTSFAFFLFLSLAFFSSIQEIYGTKYAIITTFFLVTIQNFVRHGGRMEAGIADLPLAYFIFVSAMLLLDYYKTTNKKILFLLSIFLGITALIKVEGLFITSILGVLILYFIYKQKAYTHIWVLFFWILPILDWNVYKKIHNLSLVVERVYLFSLERTFFTFYRMIQEIINIRTWNMLWIIYFATLMFWAKNLPNVVRILTIIIFSQLLIYTLIYLFVFGYDPESSFERLLLHLAPLAMYTISILFMEKKILPKFT